MFRINRCHCGTKAYVTYGLEEDHDTSCNEKCSGDSNKYCGGVLSNSIYISTPIDKCFPTHLGERNPHRLLEFTTVYGVAEVYYYPSSVHYYTNAACSRRKSRGFPFILRIASL